MGCCDVNYDSRFTEITDFIDHCMWMVHDGVRISPEKRQMLRGMISELVKHYGYEAEKWIETAQQILN